MCLFSWIVFALLMLNFKTLVLKWNILAELKQRYKFMHSLYVLWIYSDIGQDHDLWNIRQVCFLFDFWRLAGSHGVWCHFWWLSFAGWPWNWGPSHWELQHSSSETWCNSVQGYITILMGALTKPHWNLPHRLSSLPCNNLLCGENTSRLAKQANFLSLINMLFHFFFHRE